jgi:MerR family transcriptional regulator, light-induced transcriptional regulator
VYDAQTMYNIKQAAARAGVTVPVLRAWERRYGIVNPARSSGGYRQFDEESVARVRTMRMLVDDGWSPSAAAAAILAGEMPVSSAPDLTPAPRTDGRPTPGGLAPGGLASRIPAGEAEALTARFIDAARRLDPGAAAAVLDDLFARGSFERVAADLLFPALERLGEAWASGEVSVAGEHMASSAVQRRLALALEGAGSAALDRSGSRRVIVGLPSGGRHELGALAFAVAARRAGVAVTYLGSDLPLDDWVTAASGAAAAVIGAVMPRDRAAALDVARRLRSAHPDLLIAIGGRAATPSSEFMHLPDGLTDSVAALRNAMEPAAPAA